MAAALLETIPCDKPLEQLLGRSLVDPRLAGVPSPIHASGSAIVPSLATDRP